MVSVPPEVSDMRLILGPLPGPVRLQLRRLLSLMPGIEIAAQAFSLQQLGTLTAEHGAQVLMLAHATDLSALLPLPACVQRCIVLDGKLPIATPVELRVHALSYPEELDQVRPGDPFFVALQQAVGRPASAEHSQREANVSLIPSRFTPVSAHAPEQVRILAVGASTGGPDALVALLRPLAGRLTIPVVVTQHIGTGFSDALAESLAQRCQLPVHEAKDGQPLLPGHVYLAPAGRHLLIHQQQGRWLSCLDNGPPECFCKPSVDVMLRSLASLAGAEVLVVVLTGMGRDGLEGCSLLHRLGARILAQDQESSVVWGMPGAVANAGICTAIQPPASLAQTVLRLLEAPR